MNSIFLKTLISKKTYSEWQFMNYNLTGHNNLKSQSFCILCKLCRTDFSFICEETCKATLILVSVLIEMQFVSPFILFYFLYWKYSVACLFLNFFLLWLLWIFPFSPKISFSMQIYYPIISNVRICCNLTHNKQNSTCNKPGLW